MSAAEEQRAALYRTQQTARLKGRLALLGLLSGSASAAAALRENWGPVLGDGPDFDLPDVEDMDLPFPAAN